MSTVTMVGMEAISNNEGVFIVSSTVNQSGVPILVIGNNNSEVTVQLGVPAAGCDRVETVAIKTVAFMECISGEGGGDEGALHRKKKLGECLKNFSVDHKYRQKCTQPSPFFYQS